MTGRNQVVAIIQARLGSRRLPGKVLLPLGAATMLEQVVARARRARRIDQVVVATTVSAKDDSVDALCRRAGIAVFRGSEDDVLDRYYHAAVAASADVIVRITSDCPFIDPVVIDRVVDEYLSRGFDYVANNFRYTYPQGLDVEVFSFAALERAWREATLPAEREHVTPYIRSGARFRIGEVANPDDLSQRNLRWTVDEPADMEFARAVYARLDGGSNAFGMGEILALLAREPSLGAMNAGIIRHEGYYLSLTKEQPLPVTTGAGGVDVLDYGSAAADSILGQGYAAVETAVREQRRDGAGSPAEAHLTAAVSATLKGLLPGAEAVLLLDSRAAAVDRAVAAARAFTGRRSIVGVARAHRIEELQAICGHASREIAAIVIDPADIEAQTPGFLDAVRALAHRHGALLILDETHTGFRLSLGGAQAHFGVVPDLAVFGSSLANGYPIGALTGRAEIVSGALSDAPAAASLAAAKATLSEMTTKPIVGHLWEQGTRLRDGLNVLARHYGLGDVVACQGQGPLNRIVVRGRAGIDAETAEGIFSGACSQRGLVFTTRQLLRFSHTQVDTDRTLRVYRASLEILADAVRASSALRESA
ncbi:MAG TPA: aminotransferase class III-fold pyridoxal phosphate-dependent enzyme [Polyangia bacterium]|nr:aminotransferase class III-fold pyridoxal phosphate-dependent enzyme [Polyangia bacterium]